MNSKRLFKLDNRLLACSKFIKKNSNIADIGTDHAYLPIWLIKNNLISHAIACDLREGPLLNAKNNIDKYGLKEYIEMRLSNGLENVNATEVDTIVIAGMGGEIIAKIINDAPWLKNSNKNIILQPMSNDEFLREFLKIQNFEIIDEIAVLSRNKIYSAMSVKFSNEKFYTSSLYTYIGKIHTHTSIETSIYINKKIGSLKNRLLGFAKEKKFLEHKKILNVIKELEVILEGSSSK